MSLQARYECLLAVQETYLQADRARKARIPDCLRTATGLNRKYIIARLSDPLLGRRKRCLERGCEYGPDVIEAVGCDCLRIGLDLC